MKPRRRKKSASSSLSTLVVLAVFAIMVIAAIFYFSDSDPRDAIQEIGSQIGLHIPVDKENSLSNSIFNSIGTPVPSPEGEAADSSEDNDEAAAPPAQSDGKSAFDKGDFSRVLPRPDQLTVIVLDVGQGDSLFIRTPNGKNMLIDTGTSDYWKRLQFYFDELNVSKFDAVVATHPHSDHIGSMSKVIKNYDVGDIYMPRVSHTSNTYQKLLETIADQNKKVHALEGGKKQTIQLDPDVKINVFAPMDPNYEDINDHSIVLRIEYKNHSMLLTGDAEKKSENDMMDFYGSTLRSDVLKVGHHGSNTSSTKKFLEAVSPADAIISLASDNEYKHPHPKVLERLNERGISIYQTNLNSSVAVFFGHDQYEIVTAYNGE